jgi:hypothetical protein
MQKTFTYSDGWPWLLMLIVPMYFVLFMLARGYYVEAVRTEELLAKLVSLALGGSITLCGVWVFIESATNALGLRRIVVTDDLLSVQNLLHTRSILWGDIVEFGTYTCPGFYWRYSYPRRFYVKLYDRQDNRIEVCTEDLDNVRDFLDIVFQKAINARFVIVNNVAWVPFTKEIEVMPWAPHDKSFLRD